tara:strand:+ start:724 stop:1716 length:993 start_codon:yes stop_codon:yes gene_type:complete
MVYAASSSTSYELKNYPQLNSLLEKARQALESQDKFKKALGDSIFANDFDSKFQISKRNERTRMTIGELCDSYKNENTAQSIDPTAIEKVLFGADGLIKRKGSSGRCPYLMEDIEVAQIREGNFGTKGTVISSGRNRTLALQILLAAAGASPEQIRKCPVRVEQVVVKDNSELQRRIISANTASRSFSRSETRERMSASGGVRFTSKDSIRTTIRYGNEKSFAAALGAYLRFAGAEIESDYLSPAQYSAAGTNLWNKLSKEFRVELGRTFYTYCKESVPRFIAITEQIDLLLPSTLKKVEEDQSAGQKTVKFSSALFQPLAEKIRRDIGG